MLLSKPSTFYFVVLKQTGFNLPVRAFILSQNFSLKCRQNVLGLQYINGSDFLSEDFKILLVSIKSGMRPSLTWQFLSGTSTFSEQTNAA